MDEHTKVKIQELRKCGESYGRISDLLNIPTGTVKTVYRRSVANPSFHAELTCKYCHKAIVQSKTARKKMFCSATCRNKWWNENIDKVNRRAFYRHQCAYCHRQFEVYGRLTAKYCSHDCYIAARYYSK
jgi:hypothetical protein